MVAREALTIVFRPRQGWAAVRAANPPWARSLLCYALPLALLPSLAWPLGQAVSGHLPGLRESPLGGFLSGFAATLALSLATIVLVALGIYLLSRFFGSVRSWNRAAAIAAYASTPVLLCGALLAVPILIIASAGAFLHGAWLCSLGLEELLGCPSDESAAYVASVAVFTGIGSIALGALCGAIGLI